MGFKKLLGTLKKAFFEGTFDTEEKNIQDIEMLGELMRRITGNDDWEDHLSCYTGVFFEPYSKELFATLYALRGLPNVRAAQKGVGDVRFAYCGRRFLLVNPSDAKQDSLLMGSWFAPLKELLADDKVTHNAYKNSPRYNASEVRLVTDDRLSLLKDNFELLKSRYEKVMGVEVIPADMLGELYSMGFNNKWLNKFPVEKKILAPVLDLYAE